MSTKKSTECRKIIYANGTAHPKNFGLPQPHGDLEQLSLVELEKMLDEVVYMHLFFEPGSMNPGAKRFLGIGTSNFEIRRGKVTTDRLPDCRYRKFFESPDDEEGHIVVKVSRLRAILYASGLPHPFYGLTRVEVEVLSDSSPTANSKGRPKSKFAAA